VVCEGAELPLLDCWSGPPKWQEPPVYKDGHLFSQTRRGRRVHGSMVVRWPAMWTEVAGTFYLGYFCLRQSRGVTPVCALKAFRKAVIVRYPQSSTISPMGLSTLARSSLARSILAAVISSSMECPVAERNRSSASRRDPVIQDDTSNAVSPRGACS